MLSGVIAHFMRATRFLDANKMGCPDKPGNDEVGMLLSEEISL